MKEPKVIVIGLDGATLDLIEPWARDGYLPTFDRLLKEGSSGPLLTTFPPLTGPAWCSFITGKSPALHGILEFFYRQEGTYRQVLNNRSNMKGRSFWGLIGEAGKQVGVVGVPLTYPPEKVNGFLITGLLTPLGCKDFAHPPGLLAELETALGPYRLRHDEKYRPNNPWPILKEEDEVLAYNLQVARYLLQEKPWDFFMMHFLVTDRIQHEFWHLIDPHHPNHNPDERKRLGNVVLDYYQKVDTAIAKIMEVLPPDTMVLIMSDHGFGPVYKYINFNTWLHRQGLLSFKRSPFTGMRYLLFRLGLNYSVLAKLILGVGVGKQAVEVGRARREQFQRRLFLSLDDVDWNRTQVYSIGNFGQMYVNLKGREPQGCVEPGQAYERVLEDLTRRLYALRDPDTGEAVVSEVMRGPDIYQGPYQGQAPDLVFYTTRMEYKAMGLSDFSSPRVFDRVYGTTGHHRMNGVLIAHQPGLVPSGRQIKEARIIDLAPTILYRMGLPVPASMDGKVLFDLFDPAFVRGNPLQISPDSDNSSSGSNIGAPALSPDEEAELMDVLRGLGYVT